MKIGIVGNGVVGSATAAAFAEHELCVYDTDIERRFPATPTTCVYDALDSEIIFVCLPTPQRAGSMECDTSVLDDFFCSISEEGTYTEANLVLRSTVPIGYTRNARKQYDLTNLVHSPEFLTARTSVYDAENPVRIVTGIPEYQSRISVEGIDCRTIIPLLRLYSKRFPTAKHFEMSSDESEAVKLIQNAFSAVKVAFFNESRSLTDKFDLGWDRILEAVLAGGWINPRHTQVPGPDGERGFGGTCLPKDVASFAHQLLTNGLRADVCAGAYLRNSEVDRK